MCADDFVIATLRASITFCFIYVAHILIAFIFKPPRPKHVMHLKYTIPFLNKLTDILKFIYFMNF